MIVVIFLGNLVAGLLLWVQPALRLSFWGHQLWVRIRYYNKAVVSSLNNLSSFLRLWSFPPDFVRLWPSSKLLAWIQLRVLEWVFPKQIWGKEFREIICECSPRGSGAGRQLPLHGCGHFEWLMPSSVEPAEELYEMCLKTCSLWSSLGQKWPKASIVLGSAWCLDCTELQHWGSNSKRAGDIQGKTDLSGQGKGWRNSFLPDRGAGKLHCSFVEHSFHPTYTFRPAPMLSIHQFGW